MLRVGTVFLVDWRSSANFIVCFFYDWFSKRLLFMWHLLGSFFGEKLESLQFWKKTIAFNHDWQFLWKNALFYSSRNFLWNLDGVSRLGRLSGLGQIKNKSSPIIWQNFGQHVKDRDTYYCNLVTLSPDYLPKCFKTLITWSRGLLCDGQRFKNSLILVTGLP